MRHGFVLSRVSTVSHTINDFCTKNKKSWTGNSTRHKTGRERSIIRQKTTAAERENTKKEQKHTLTWRNAITAYGLMFAKYASQCYQ